MELMEREHVGSCAFAASHDPRGEGTTLYRCDDHPRIDFRLIKDDPEVIFAHANGFIAKTRTKLSPMEALSLVRASIICI